MPFKYACMCMGSMHTCMCMGNMHTCIMYVHTTRNHGEPKIWLEGAIEICYKENKLVNNFVSGRLINFIWMSESSHSVHLLGFQGPCLLSAALFWELRGGNWHHHHILTFIIEVQKIKVILKLVITTYSHEAQWDYVLTMSHIKIYNNNVIININMRKIIYENTKLRTIYIDT